MTLKANLKVIAVKRLNSNVIFTVNGHALVGELEIGDLLISQSHFFT